MRASLLLATSLTLGIASAQPQITEFVASNVASLADGDGNFPDWIEIHNPDATTLDLAGYHLTDNIETPQKYTFPAGTTIPAGGRLIVFASGQANSSYIDGSGFRHTNFSLNSNGEYLALAAPDGSVLQAFSPSFPPQFNDISYGAGSAAPLTTHLSAGASSKWLVPTSNIGTSWQTPAFDDTAWNTASTGLGYGYDNTLIGTGGNTSAAMWFGNPSVYLRIPFQISNPAEIASLNLAMRFEDGFVAYLNGTRVASSNAPDSGTLAFNSTATAEHPNALAIIAENFTLPASTLVTGTNILAIQGLNLSSSGANSNDFLLLPELQSTGDAAKTFGFYTTPTPGAPNTGAFVSGFVKDTKFSHKRGYYDTTINLAITTTTPDATIIYTTDGTPPSDTNGTTYTGPIAISGTTTIRTFARKVGFQPTNIDTQSFLFVSDIVRQTRPAGYPATWGGAPADYDMDPDVVNNPEYANIFDDAFAALPTLSLVCEPDAFFHSTTGIYQKPQSEGSAWERPTSAEFFTYDGSESGFQIDAGVRIQGGSSRSTDTPKHSLSLRFRSEYGAGKLRYPLYKNSPVGDSAPEVFDVLQLRPEYNFGWMHRHWYQCQYALYGRDQWASDLFNQMGNDGSHGRWVHLFLNGIYWGLYDLHERPDAEHMSNKYGGTTDDYDTINSSVATNGDLVAFNQMMDLAYGSIQTPATYNAIQQYLNVESFIDYMILNTYIGNRDWDAHNWRAGRKREAGAGFRFYPWDSEFGISHVGGGAFPSPPNFFTTTLATNVSTNNGNRRPTGLQQRLALNEEYRILFADHIRAHFFNEGPLSPSGSSEAWAARSGPMFDAIVAESARWGDFRRDVSSGSWASSQFDLYTRNGHYLPTLNWVNTTYLPQRSDIVLAQFRSRGLYPATNAPDFSQHGGTVAAGSQIQLTAPATILYTTDGSDPRLVGGNVSPTATSIASGAMVTLAQSTQLKARARAASGEWSALTSANFTVNTDDLIVSEIMYRPATNPLAEFLEIQNTGALTVSLQGLHFTQGLSFNFDAHSTIASLAPGARILLVRNLAAFQAIYGNTHDALIAGTFQEDTALSDGGETLTIADANGATVLTFRYDDEGSWPLEPDGLGHSLVFTGGDPNLPENWRPSATLNGNPGSSDSTPFTEGSLLTYALAGETSLTPHATGATFRYTANLTADNARFQVQYSSNLSDWNPVNLSTQTQVLNPGNATRTFTLELPEGLTGFARVIVTTK